MSKFTWNEDNTKALTEAAGPVGTLITQVMLVSIAETIGNESTRSVGSKLRNLGYEVQKASEVPSSRWSEAEEAALTAYVKGNPNAYTYAEIASTFAGGKYTAKQIQGKLLNLELFSLVKPTAKSAAPRKYTEAEEATIVEMAAKGAYLEAIAEALGKDLNSVRGKALSMQRAEQIESIPVQEFTKEVTVAQDVFHDLEDIASMSVEDIAEAVGKSARSVKGMLSRRGIDCADYKGATKRAKLDAKKEA